MGVDPSFWNFLSNQGWTLGATIVSWQNDSLKLVYGLARRKEHCPILTEVVINVFSERLIGGIMDCLDATDLGSSSLNTRSKYKLIGGSRNENATGDDQIIYWLCYYPSLG